MYSYIWDSLFKTTKVIMEEDILNYSPTVIFRGTPCTWLNLVWCLFTIFLRFFIYKERNKFTVTANHKYKETDKGV